MKIYYQIDGGGTLGATAAKYNYELEKILGRPLCRFINHGFCTSTGAVQLIPLALGVSAEKIFNFYNEDCRELFKPRSIINPLNWFKYKYDKSKFYKKAIEVVGPDVLLNESNFDLTVTSMNGCSKRTHYINSSADEKLKAVDAMAWSAFSAVYYFGPYKIRDYEWVQVTHEGNLIPRIGAVWYDGGQGVNNCTITDIISHAYANYPNEEVIVISLGTGNEDMYVPYEEASDDNKLIETIKMLTQARGEAIYDQVANARYINDRNKKFKFFRLDYTIPKSKNQLDNVKDLDYFINDGFSKFNEIIPVKTMAEILKKNLKE